MRKFNVVVIRLLVVWCVVWSFGMLTIQAEETKTGEATPEEQAAFDTACEENTTKSYEAYLQQYPDGIFVSEVNLKIETLQWERAVDFNYLTVFEQYLKAYPEGTFVAEAQEKIKQIEDIRCSRDIDEFLASYETHYKDSISPAHLKYIQSTSALDIAMAGMTLVGVIADIREKEATWEQCLWQ